MKNLVDFKIDIRLEQGVFYLNSQYFSSIEEYIEEMYDGSIKEFRSNVKEQEEQSGRDGSEKMIDEIVGVMKDWFGYKVLLTSRGIEDQQIVNDEDVVLIIRDEKCKIWIESDGENGGFTVHKDTHADYDNRGEYDDEYSSESFGEDIVKEYTYEELALGVEVDGVGFDVWIGNDSETDGKDGLRLVYRKI